MTRAQYRILESYMLQQALDSAHDAQHIYRVLYAALRLARAYPAADLDVLIAACLLHDVGRAAQNANPALCHARVGAQMARDFLLNAGWDAAFAGHVSDCVRTHRFRSDDPPVTLEARLLFDADKLDVTGAMGVARTLMYNGRHGEPLYTVRGSAILHGDDAQEPPSFAHEYHHKLRRLKDALLTSEAKALAAQRQATVDAFYHALMDEACSSNIEGRSALNAALEEV